MTPAPQTECCLQPQRHRCVRVGDSAEFGAGQFVRLADVRDVPSVANAAVVVAARDDVLFAELLGPPAQIGHPVLDGAHCQTLGLPPLDQPSTCLGLTLAEAMCR